MPHGIVMLHGISMLHGIIFADDFIITLLFFIILIMLFFVHVQIFCKPLWVLFLKSGMKFQLKNEQNNFDKTII